MENYKDTNQLNFESGKVNGFQGQNLIELENGGLKKVKVDAFATYPMHQHPGKTEFIYVLKGQPKIIIGDKIYMGKPDDFFTLPKSIMHAIENPNQDECLLLVGAIKTKQ